MVQALENLLVADGDPGEVVVARLPAVGVVDAYEILAGNEGNTVGGSPDLLGVARAGAEIERAAGPRAFAELLCGPPPMYHDLPISHGRSFLREAICRSRRVRSMPTA